MKKFCTVIDNEDNLRLQAAEYMSYSSQKVVDIAIEKNDIDISKERFKVLLDDYIDKNVMYETLKNEMIKNYVPRELIRKIVNWNLDFSDGALVIEFSDDFKESDKLFNARYVEVKD